MQQVRYYKGPPYNAIDPKDVNLVLLDGCINDVGALERLTNPKVSPNEVTHQAKLGCFDGMVQLLKEVSTKFPNAKIIVTGYYQEVSKG
jgi:hypothetical protein